MVASLPAGSRAKTVTGALQILIVAKDEERDADRGILDADAATGERRIAHLADSDAGGDIGRRRTKHHELGAAVIDEMVQREHADARRLEPHLEIACDAGLGLSQSVQHRPTRHVMTSRAGPGLRVGIACLPMLW